MKMGLVTSTKMDASGNVTPAYLAERDDLETPHQCTAEEDAPDAGAALDELETHAAEFHMLVEEMFEKLPEETRILEGMAIPTYADLVSDVKNELSDTMEIDDNGQCTGNVDSQ